MVLPVAAAKHQQECVAPLTSWLDAYQHNEKHPGAQKSSKPRSLSVPVQLGIESCMLTPSLSLSSERVIGVR